MQEQNFDNGEFSEAVSNLVLKAEFPSKFRLMALEGGRNNKVFCIDCGNKKALLKAYFQHAEDKRERLKAEYTFLNFAHSKKVQCVPKPIAADFQNNLGLYEFIEGRKLSSSEVDQEKIISALNFFIDINKYKNTSEAKSLPIASDACFSIKEHIAHVEKRIKRLKNTNSDSNIDAKVSDFVNNELLKEWQKSLEDAKSAIRKLDLRIDERINTNERYISPSDFGFHNALLKDDKLRFIDFEYAGWDDPAKMACDFFSQPEVRVPLKYFEHFVNTAADSIANPEEFKKRVASLLPLYKVKWCCIMLNDFIRVDLKRRNFAYGKIDYEKNKIMQLEKAKRYLCKINL